MDFTAPSFSLGIDLDDDHAPPPAAGSRRREQSRGYVAPDPPSFSLGFDFDEDEEEEPRRSAGGRDAERARGYAAPDPPSFSLGVGLGDEEEEESQLPSGGRRVEQARRYEAPDAPSFSLRIDDDGEFLPGGKQAQPQVALRASSSSTGIEEEEEDFALNGGKPPSPPPEANRFKRLRKGPGPSHLTPARQIRRYDAPDAPSFDLAIEGDDILLGDQQHHEQLRPHAESRVPSSICVEEDDDDFVAGDRRSERVQCETPNADPLPPPTRLKRLERGTEPPHSAPKPSPSKAPKLSMAEASPEVTRKGALDVGSLEDEIEDFTDDEGLVRDVPPSVGSCSINSKFSLRALLSQSATKAKMSKFKQQPVSSASKSLEESCTKKLLPKITISPMRKIHLLDSDTDEDDDYNQNKAKKPVSAHKNRQESMNKYIQKDPTLQQNSKPQGSTAGLKSQDNWATPALDEFCSEYFNSTKDSGQPRQKENKNFCHSNVSQTNSIGQMEGHFYQSSSSGAVLDHTLTDNSPPAVHYFFHHDPMVRDLVHKRLQHFFPIGTESTRGNEQSRAENLSYRQFDSNSGATNGWVTPSGRIPVPTDVGRRRVHASGTQSGSGHWYTGEDGRKVYVSKNGQELTGQNAYRQYKKESGRGFHRYRKKGATKQGASESKRGAAKPKKEPASTKQGASRARRKR